MSTQLQSHIQSIIGYKINMKLYNKNKVNLERIRDLESLITPERMLLILKMQNIFVYPTKIYKPVF